MDTVHPQFAEGDLGDYRRWILRLAVWTWTGSLVLVYFVATVLPSDQVVWAGVYATLGFGILSVLALATIPWHRIHPNWVMTILFLGVAEISALILFSGGHASPFFSLFLFGVIFSAAFFSGAAFIAAVVLVCLGSVSDQFVGSTVRIDPVDYLRIPVFVATAVVAKMFLNDLQQRSAEARRNLRQIQVHQGAARLLYAETAREALIQKLLELVRESTEARYAAIHTFDEAGGLDRFFQVGLSKEEAAQLGQPPRNIGVLGAITKTASPVRLEDVRRDPRHLGFPPGHPPMRSFLGVPILARDRLLGQLYVTEKSGGRPFTAEDEALLVNLARDASIAIENAHLLEQVQALAVTDGLTGLSNHRTFQEHLREEIERAERYHRVCALLMIDVDNFKNINDLHGHPVGDEVLKQIAGTLRKMVRSIDLCARYGGEEFAVVLPETDQSGGRIVAERIRQAVEAIEFRTPNGQALSLRVSIGLAAYPEKAASAKGLIERADVYLTDAKFLGKNCVVP